jgi:cell division protein FtsW (lipid II flippase)
VKIKKVLKIRTHPHGVDGVIQLKSVNVVVIRIPASTEENASLSKKWTKGSLSAPARNISLATSARTVILHVFFLLIFLLLLFLFHSFFPFSVKCKKRWISFIHVPVEYL